MEAEPGKRAREEDEEKEGGRPSTREKRTTEINPSIFDEEIEIEEETMREVMKWLDDKETNSAPLSLPPSSPSNFQEKNYVTINVNEDSCRPTISSSASTVMASVDTRTGRCGLPYFVGCPSDPAERLSAPSLMPTPAFLPLKAVEDGCSTAAEQEVDSADGLVGAGGDGEAPVVDP